jgi:hypothetical protein
LCHEWYTPSISQWPMLLNTSQHGIITWIYSYRIAIVCYSYRGRSISQKWWTFLVPKVIPCDSQFASTWGPSRTHLYKSIDWRSCFTDLKALRDKTLRIDPIKVMLHSG